MAKYFEKTSLKELNEARKKIFKIRADIYKKYNIDVLDTDALSSLSIHEIISQYDSDYNINFARNGEDAISNGVLVEQKAARVSSDFTKTGKIRKNAGQDAQFQFHAMGDIVHDRYVFVARSKEDLSILRIYDISKKANCKIVQQHLEQERGKWLAKGLKDKKKMKHDLIILSEKYLLDSIKFDTITVNSCKVFRDND